MRSQASSRRLLSVLTALALVLSLYAPPALAAEESACDLVISLTEAGSVQARIPVELSREEAEAAAKSAVWSLVRDPEREYLDPELYPSQKAGGPLADWVCSDGKTPLFTDLKSGCERVNGRTFLVLEVQNACYFGRGGSVPHSNGGSYMDVCGYFRLTVSRDGKELGAVPVKITPYEQFHTMEELDAELDAIADYAAKHTDLYVEKRSMGSSQGDNGFSSLDMPYLIVAKDRAAVERWLDLKAQAEEDPAALIARLESGALKDYQVPVLYSNIHANEVSAADGILGFAWMLVRAAGEGKPMTYDRLAGFTAAGEAELKRQLGAAGVKGSVAVPELVQDSATYLGYLKGENQSASGPVELEKYYVIRSEAVEADELLDDVFFLIVPEENVEGRTYLTRTSSGGFDLNRDNSFQTQAETQNMTRLIAAWNPVSFTEFHGQVQSFQCEPCSPPHEPNFEYDLLAEHLMAGGEALGVAAVANNDRYNSYVIPQRDYLRYTGQTADGEPQTQWQSPWDDMSTSYTPQYAMLHGTVSYTVELPAYNDSTADAVLYGQLGQSHYIAQNKRSYLLAQARIFERGVTNANSDAFELVGQWFADQYDVEGAEGAIFRPEYDGQGQNGNFYPECYILPLDGENQSNLQAACDMVEYLDRNGVKLHAADRSFRYNGTQYPAGTAVISMYQAKRSVANGVLYDGTVITGWSELYSEGITAFDKTRGFDLTVCAEPAAYREIMEAVRESTAQSILADARRSSFTGVKDKLVVLKNASEDAAAAVNALLRDGKKVSLITGGAYKGSFLCSYADWSGVAEDYVLTGVGAASTAWPVKALRKAPVVYITGRPSASSAGFAQTALVSGAYEYNYDRQAMELMGFSVTRDAAEADLILGASALDRAGLAAVRSGVPYIGYGSRAVSSAVRLFPEGELVRESAGSSAMDALAYVTYPTQTLLNASYIAEGDDILYGYGAGYFSAVPKGAKILVRLDGSRGLLEGFLPSAGAHYRDFLNDSIQAISYQGEGADGAQLNVTLFANTLTNKVHQRDEFAFLSNAAFASVLED